MKKDLSVLSDNELNNKYKKLRFFFGVYIGIITVSTIISIVGIIKGSVKPSTFLFIVFLGGGVSLWSYIEKVKKELQSRT